MAIKKVTLPDNSTQDINDSRIASADITKWNAIENFVFVQGSSSAAGNGASGEYLSTKWEGTVSGVTTPTNGMKIAYRVATNAGVSTAGAVLSIDSGTTYKPVVFNVNSVIGTRYSVGSTLLMTYNSTQTASAYLTSNKKTTVTGCWQVMDYSASNTDTKVRQYQSGANAAGTSPEYPLLARYALTNQDGTYEANYSRFHTGATVNTSTGGITAASFKKTGGTSSQFLKADGSVDSNNYLTSYIETDPVFTASAAHGITSSNISAWNAKQDALVSGTNIKTVNNESLLGGGNVSIVGEKGDTGPAGITPSLSIGTVTTLSPGASATATITGTSAQPVLNLGIPQGSQGNSGYSGTDTLELVNNLTDGGTTSALTAEQGKVLKALIDANSASLDELWDEISEGEAMFTNENNIRLITLSISGDVYDSMSLYAIKQLSTVTSVMDDNTSSAITDFTLSGITQAGPQVFTATYDTFKASTSKTVLVRTSTLSSISAVCSVSEVSLYSELDDLRQYLTVSKVYADTTTEATEDYTLSGTITSSSSTITVTYNPDTTKTTTFTVTGVSDGSYVQDSLSSMVDFSQYEDNYTGDILDEVSGNAITLSGSLAVAATKAPYGGLHNGMLVLCRWNVGADFYGLSPTLAGSSPAAPLTIEFYGRLRAPYEPGGTTPTIGTLSSSRYRICMFDSSATNTNKFAIRFANDGEIVFFGPVAEPNVTTSGAAIPFYDSSHTSVKDLTHIVVCMQTSHTWIYVNGTLITESTSGTYDCLGGGDLVWFVDEALLAADICMLRTYSKVLNAGEVERNYQNCVGIWGTTME